MHVTLSWNCQRAPLDVLLFSFEMRILLFAQHICEIVQNHFRKTELHMWIVDPLCEESVFHILTIYSHLLAQALMSFENVFLNNITLVMLLLLFFIIALILFFYLFYCTLFVADHSKMIKKRHVVFMILSCQNRNKFCCSIVVCICSSILPKRTSQ